jgi:hypothetical protein
MEIRMIAKMIQQFFSEGPVLKGLLEELFKSTLINAL